MYLVGRFRVRKQAVKAKGFRFRVTSDDKLNPENKGRRHKCYTFNVTGQLTKYVRKTFIS